jgi:hypothetical protein
VPAQLALISKGRSAALALPQKRQIHSSAIITPEMRRRLPVQGFNTDNRVTPYGAGIVRWARAGCAVGYQNNLRQLHVCDIIGTSWFRQLFSASIWRRLIFMMYVLT